MARPAARAHLTTSVQTRRRVVVGTVIALYVLALSISLMIVIKGNHFWGIHTQPTGDKIGAWQIIWVDRGLAADYDIMVGDQVTAVNGHPPRSDQEINYADSLVIRKPAGKVLTLRWEKPSPLLAVAWIVSGLLCLIPGVLVFLHAIDRHLAWRFLLLWSALGIACALAGAEPYGNLLTEHLQNALFTGIGVGAMANVIWLLLFPVVGQSQRRHRWLPEIPLLTGLLFVIGYLAALQLQNAPLLMIFLIWAGLQAAVCLGFALVSVLVVSCSRHPTIARERARVLLGGLLVGVIPPLILDVLPTLLGGTQFVVSALSIAVLPFAFAYALVRRDLVHLDSFIRHTARLLLSLIGTGMMAILVTQGLLLLPPVLALLLGFGAGGMLIPAVFVVAQWLTEAWLFPQVRHYRRIIAQQLGEESISDPHLLAQQLIARVRLALPVEAVMVFVRNKAGEYEALTPQSGNNTLDGAPPSLLNLDEDLLLWLHRRGKPAQIRPAQLQTAGISSDQATQHIMPPLWAILVPIRLQERTIGIVALSKREDGQPFVPADIMAISALAGQYAVALEFALSYSIFQVTQEQKERLEEWKDHLIGSMHATFLTPLALLRRHLAQVTGIAPEQIKQQPEWVAQELYHLWQESLQLDQAARRWQTDLDLNGRDQAVQSQPVEICGLVEHAMEAAQPRAAERRITLRNHLPRQTRGWIVLADQTILYRVVQRLLANAIKASLPGGWIEVQAREIHRPDQPSLIHLVIQDFGGPVPRDAQFLLFEKYTRVDGERENLALSREMIRQFEGDMGIDNDGQLKLVSCWINLPLATASMDGFEGERDASQLVNANLKNGNGRGHLQR